MPAMSNKDVIDRLDQMFRLMSEMQPRAEARDLTNRGGLTGAMQRDPLTDAQLNDLKARRVPIEKVQFESRPLRTDRKQNLPLALVAAIQIGKYILCYIIVAIATVLILSMPGMEHTSESFINAVGGHNPWFIVFPLMALIPWLLWVAIGVLAQQRTRAKHQRHNDALDAENAQITSFNSQQRQAFEQHRNAAAQTAAKNAELQQRIDAEMDRRYAVDQARIAKLKAQLNDLAANFLPQWAVNRDDVAVMLRLMKNDPELTYSSALQLTADENKRRAAELDRRRKEQEAQIAAMQAREQAIRDAEAQRQAEAEAKRQQRIQMGIVVGTAFMENWKREADRQKAERAQRESERRIASDVASRIDSGGYDNSDQIRKLEKKQKKLAAENAWMKGRMKR